VAPPLYEEASHRLVFPAGFKLYADRVEAYFWPYRRVIPVSEIVAVRVLGRIPWYVGWGLRLDPLRRRLYFALHHGRSVEIDVRKGYWRRVVLSVKEPDRFASLLAEQIKPTPS